jgi:hypothetical protein
MKLTLNVLERERSDTQKRWPNYVFGGRIRTSTLVLVIVFFAVWWTYDTYRPEVTPKPPPTQVVPPGFVPDPNYTWVPRSKVQEPPVYVTPTRTTTTPPPPPPVTTTTTTPSVTTTTPAPFQLPTLPCLLPQPLCPPSTSPTPPPALPQPGPGPAPSSSPPAS